MPERTDTPAHWARTPQPPLPSVQELATTQVRGVACVWCAVALDNATAVDLGPRTVRVYDNRARWFPRSCPGCAASLAAKRQRVDTTYRAYLQHLQDCAGCATGDAPCEPGKQLRAAHQEALRP